MIHKAVSYLALFLALGGATAYAAATIGSAEVIDESLQSVDLKNGEVKGGDLATNSVTANKVTNNTLTGDDVNESTLRLGSEAWHEVGAPGEPVFNISKPWAMYDEPSCGWRNYPGANHNSAAFLRDREGFVHLKGLVQAYHANPHPTNFRCRMEWPNYVENEVIFTLPPGYRPARREVHVGISKNSITRMGVDGPPLGGQPAGAVSVHWAQTNAPFDWVSLDGISFRCAPSGVDGCP